MGSIFSQDKRTFIRSTFAGAGVSVLAAVLDQVLLFLQRRVEAQLRENLSANLLRAPAHPLCAPLRRRSLCARATVQRKVRDRVALCSRIAHAAPGAPLGLRIPSQSEWRPFATERLNLLQFSFGL